MDEDRGLKRMSMIKTIAVAQAIGGGGEAPVLVSKTVTENGIYAASTDNADGYRSVTVALPSGDEVSY